MPSNFASSPSQLTNILLIDDNVNDLKFWSHSLQDFEKYRILTAMSGIEGLELCKASHIDCVVLDLDLSQNSGFQVFFGLCQGGERPRVPIGILTKTNYPPLREMALRYGVSFWLEKGETSPADLDRAIQQAITV